MGVAGIADRPSWTDRASDERVLAKCAWRLMPLILIAYVINYTDRTNIGFAALTMNRDLGLAPSVYGFGAGLFFVSYSVFQVPANLVLYRVGARRWISCILLAWGAAATAGALIRGPYSLYLVRFLLGVAEAGFFPGIILYLTLWFPKAWLGRTTAVFMAASNFGFTIGGPLATAISQLNGVGGIRGWQWLFLLEGLPACAMAFVILKFIPDGPAVAPWLHEDERRLIADRLQGETGAKRTDVLLALMDVRVLALGIAYGGILTAIYGLNFWMPLLLQSAGFSNSAAGIASGLLYGSAIPVMILWGRSSDRKGERSWHAATAALFAAVALLIASVVSSTPVLLLALMAAAIGSNSVLPPFYMLAPLFLSGRAMAAGFALVSSIGGLIGGFAGQYLIGVVREWSGGYGLVLGVMAAAIATAGLIVIALDHALAPQGATTKPIPAE